MSNVHTYLYYTVDILKYVMLLLCYTRVWFLGFVFLLLNHFQVSVSFFFLRVTRRRHIQYYCR